MFQICSSEQKYCFLLYGKNWEYFCSPPKFDPLIFVFLLSSFGRLVDNLTKKSQIIKHQIQKYRRRLISKQREEAYSTENLFPILGIQNSLHYISPMLNHQLLLFLRKDLVKI